MKKLYSFNRNTGLIKIFLFIFLTGIFKIAGAQIYFHDFTGATGQAPPYTTAPNILATNLSGSSWTDNSPSPNFTATGGVAGTALSVTNSGSSPFTYTLTFNIAAGYNLSISSFRFWRVRSPNGPQNWSMTINGISVGSGTVPTSGAYIPVTTVLNPVNNLTGLVTVILSLNAPFAGNGGTFRLDDFTLNGSVGTSPTLSVSTSLSDFGQVCTNTATGGSTFVINGTTLTTANVVVGPLMGYKFSLTNGSFTNSLSIAQPGGTFTKTVYAQFLPTLVQSYNGNIPLSGGGAPAITTPVTGSGINTGPSITNGTISSVTTNGATITVTVVDPGCSPVVAGAYGVEYSTVTPFPNGSGTAVISGNLSGGVFSVNLTGLVSPGTTFYIHTYATNSSGITTYGVEQSFTLLSTTPSLSVPSAGAGSLAGFGGICVNTATATNTFSLSGSVLNGSNITVGPLANFTFATTVGGPFNNTVVLTVGGTGYTYSGGNLSGCTIYVQFAPTVVQSYNGAIPVSGGGAAPIGVPVTASGINNIPALSTGNAIFVSATDATLPGTIIDQGCGVMFDYGIEYSTTAAFPPGTGTQVSGSNLGTNDFSVDITALLPNTTYYYYAYATNAAGTGYGLINSFTTFGVPTKLVVIAVSPASPIALTPFSITVQAQDASGTPVDVTADTDISLAQAAGVNILTVPGTPAGTIPQGTNTIVIDDLVYDAPETNVGVTATASAGMTLGTSVIKLFNVVAYTGPTTFIWTGNNNSAWLNGSYWQTGTSPGSVGSAINQHVASFTSIASLLNSGIGGSGINMNAVTGNLYSVGAIYFTETYAFAHTSNVVPLGNSSTSSSGTLYLHGAPLNSVGGIAGNNYSSLLIGNYMNDANTKTLEIKNAVSGGTQNLTLNLASTGSIVAGVGRIIKLSLLLTGTQPVTYTGGGTFTLTPSGAGTINIFSGTITVANGILTAGNSGAFSAAAPNIVTLGSAANAGILRLNGNNITIGGINGSALGNANIVDNGSASATLTIKNTAGYIFNGSLANGTSGILSIIKTGAGIQTLTGLSSYSGTTAINQGILQLNRPGGGTLPSSTSINLTGGTLRVSSDQTISNLSISGGGSLTVDLGVTLTITGTYTPAVCTIINNGTIKLQGSALQSFPGVSASVTNMNNLTINNLFGVNLNKSLNVAGVLTLTNGTFTVGANTLTINNPIAATTTNLAAGNTSSITIAGTAAGVNIPSSVTLLNNLTVSNSAGTTLQGNLNIAGTAFITTTAGTVDAGVNTFNGTGNLTMTGGNLLLAKNGVVQPELSGLYNLTGGTVSFNGVGITTDAQTVRPVNYYNLLSSSTGDRILSSTGTIGVFNVFTPFNNSYIITGSTVNFNKTSAGQLVPAFTYYNIMLSGGGSVSKALGGNINVINKLVIAANTKFDLSASNATLKSDAANTASVDVIPTANSVTYGGAGRFIVERYIPVGVTHAKSWQLLGSPTKGQTINQAWQEGLVLPAIGTMGLGTILTTNDPAGVGFDIIGGSGPSIKTFNPAGAGSWVGVPNTNAQIANQVGYMVFIRGDRSVVSSSQSAVVTTLRTTGKIFAPGADAPPAVAVGTAKLQSVANPYASPIDFLNLLTTAPALDTKFYVWDPLLPGTYGYGAYQTISSTNSYIPMPGGTTNYPTGVPYTKIQSGQAFFVYSTAGGSVSFAETNKAAGAYHDAYRSAGYADRQYLRAYLFTNSGNLADGNAVVFDPAFDNSYEANDAIKPDNFGENFGIRTNDKTLAVEARQTVQDADTIFYTLGNLKTQQYNFHFGPENMASTGLTAFFGDKFLGTLLPLSLTDSTTVNFEITADPLSKAAGRFYIILKQPRPVPVTITGISATRNSNESISINWNVENELNITGYELEKSGDGRNFSRIAITAPRLNNGSYATYTHIDEAPSPTDNFYRVKLLVAGGQAYYSAIVKLSSLKAGPSFSIYPNPVVDKLIHIKFTGQSPGNYKLQLVNNAGQMVYDTQLQLAAGNTTTSFALPKGIASGNYKLRLNGPDGIHTVLQVFIQ